MDSQELERVLGAHNGPELGPFRRYIDAGIDGPTADIRRRDLIRRIEKTNGRKLLIYAADPRKGVYPSVDIMMLPTDHTPLIDVLDSIPRDSDVDVLIESPGGLASVAEYISRILRERFRSVRFFVPHMAMSAATILVLSGDEILMDDRSSLGPIDPQVPRPNAIPFPAQNTLDYLEQVADEEARTGRLSLVTLAILSRITPADIQMAINATEEGRRLVRNWLTIHMWRNLKDAKGIPIPRDQREAKANLVAEELAKHKKWLNHGKMLSRTDLLNIDRDLLVADYSKWPSATDMWELWVNLHFTFGIGGAYKIYESATSRIVKSITIAASTVGQQAPGAAPSPQGAPGKPPSSAVAGLTCPNCGAENQVQADFEPGVPTNPQARSWPPGDRIKCSSCRAEIDLAPVRTQIKASFGRDILIPPSAP